MSVNQQKKGAGILSAAGVLLAGGRSLRMGSDKALLRAGGVELWRRQRDLLRWVCGGNVWVSARVRPDWLPEGGLWIADACDAGPMGGVVTALGEVEEEYALALALDLPFVSEAFLEEIVRRLEPGMGVVPRRGGMFEPLVAAYPKEALASGQARLGSGEFGLQKWIVELESLGLMKIFDVDTKWDAVFFNANTPEDWEKVAE